MAPDLPPDALPGDRRKFRREGEERRREALVTAALEIVARQGMAAATVRAIADRAGVTPGLIRHYFDGREALMREAFRVLMDRMTADSAAAAEEAGGDPLARIAAYVTASVRPAQSNAEAVSLWAGFLNAVRSDPAMRAVHEATYLGYRDELQGLIAALPGWDDPARARQAAIAVNAVIDGLWMEGAILPHAFAPGETERIARAAAGAILGVRLEEGA
jgi:AcrR family transcriptional regulator